MNAITVEIRKDAWSIMGMKRNHFSTTVLGSRLITGGNDNDKLNSLLDFISDNGLEGVGVAVVLPADLVLSRVIRVPAPNHEAIKGIVRFELEKHIPYEIDEVHYGFQVLGTKDNLYTVQITVVRKDDLENITELFDGSNIKIVSVDSSQVSLFNALAHCNKLPMDDAFSLVYIRDDISMIDTFVGSVPVDSRVIKCGVINRGEDKRDIVRELTAAAISAHESAWAKRPEKVIMIGEAPVVDDLAIMLEECTDFKVIKADLSDLEVESDSLPTFGLALDVLGKGKLTTNLMSTPDLKRMKVTHRPTALLAAVAVILLISLGASYLLIDKLTLRRYEIYFSKIETETENLRKSSARLKSLNERVGLLEEAKSRTVPEALDILSELSSLLPSGTWLTSFEVKDDVLYINGLSDQASSLLLQMEQSRMIKDVEFLGQITKAMDEKESFRTKALIVGSR